MKILMINSVCGIKSTGRICTDLAVALKENGHEVKIGYGRETIPAQYKQYAVRIDSNMETALHGLKARLLDADGQGSIIATKRFLKWVKAFDPDVIHLHNLHGYYINVPLLFDYIINRKKKVIWTLHDMWSFTGHSCFCETHNCDKWQTCCDSCPCYRGYPSSMIDRSQRNYLWKKELFSRVEDMTLVVPSKWLAILIGKSFLKEKKTIVIPNGIDTGRFKPVNSDFKKTHHIESKRLIMGSASSWGPKKGLNDFIQLSKIIDEKYKIVLVGLSKEQMRNLPERIIGIERTNSVEELVQIYSAADLFLNLTYSDNYPTVNLEAIACGTPVITYDTGGSAECLDGRNGKAFPQGDLEGIARFLDSEYHENMFHVNSQAANEKSSAARAYLTLYDA